MAWKTLRYDQIEAFKASWPCHGLPPTLHSLSVATNGNIEAYDDEQKRMDTAKFDGPALVALIKECRNYGDPSD